MVAALKIPSARGVVTLRCPPLVTALSTRRTENARPTGGLSYPPAAGVGRPRPEHVGIGAQLGAPPSSPCLAPVPMLSRLPPDDRVDTGKDTILAATATLLERRRAHFRRTLNRHER